MVYSYKCNKCRIGLGVMRLIQNPDGSFPGETRELLHYAYKSGIRYYDTGYEYLKGKSEMLIGEELVPYYPRNELCIADKMPVWKVESYDDFERILDEQLKRLGVDYIDFYLLHALNGVYWSKIRDLDVLSFLYKKKEEGIIKNVGFSFHDNVRTLNNILNDYEWDFCQLQLNYYDWLLQSGRDNYNLCKKNGIPISVMEPLGGGRLIRIPKEAERVIRNSGYSPATFAMKYVLNLSQVFMVLSGATNKEQLRENLDVMVESITVNESLYNRVSDIIRDKSSIQCTGCGYCIEYCPKKIDIPLCFQKYNDYKLLGIPGQYRSLGEFYFDCIPENSRADNCIKCGMCAKRCPQKIDIPGNLSMIHKNAEESLLGVTIYELKEKLEDKSIVCFGAGNSGLRFSDILNKYGLSVSFFCDNSEMKWNKEFNGILVIDPKSLKENRDKYAVLISSNYYNEIKKQLIEMGVVVLN